MKWWWRRNGGSSEVRKQNESYFTLHESSSKHRGKLMRWDEQHEPKLVCTFFYSCALFPDFFSVPFSILWKNNKFTFTIKFRLFVEEKKMSERSWNKNSATKMNRLMFTRMKQTVACEDDARSYLEECFLEMSEWSNTRILLTWIVEADEKIVSWFIYHQYRWKAVSLLILRRMSKKPGFSFIYACF